MTGIGLIITLFHLAPFFGFPPARDVLQVINTLPSPLVGFNAQAVAIGTATMVLVFVLPALFRRLPSSLLALIAVTIGSVWLDMDVPRIGALPSGLLLPHVPGFVLSDLHVVIMGGIALAKLRYPWDRMMYPGSRIPQPVCVLTAPFTTSRLDLPAHVAPKLPAFRVNVPVAPD